VANLLALAPNSYKSKGLAYILHEHKQLLAGDDKGYLVAVVCLIAQEI